MTRLLSRCGLSVFLLLVPVWVQGQDHTDIERTLHRLGLDRLFESLQPVVQSALADATKTPDAVRQAIDNAFSVDYLWPALVSELAQAEPAIAYAEVAASLEDPAIDAAQGACSDLPGYGVAEDLIAYQQKLAARSARPIRMELARQMDSSARTSSIAASAYTRVEQIVVEHSRPQLSAQIPWADITAQRRLALQDSVVVWYLYCGRYAGNDVLGNWIAYYDQDAVQRVLDQYQQALALVLERASLAIGQQLSSSLQ